MIADIEDRTHPMAIVVMETLLEAATNPTCASDNDIELE